MNTGINERGTGPCGQCGGTDTAHVDVMFPVTGWTSYGPVHGQPIVLAVCSACGYLTRDLDGVVEGVDSRIGHLVLGIAGPLQQPTMTAYGEQLIL